MSWKHFILTKYGVSCESSDSSAAVQAPLRNSFVQPGRVLVHGVCVHVFVVGDALSLGSPALRNGSTGEPRVHGAR